MEEIGVISAIQADGLAQETAELLVERIRTSSALPRRFKRIGARSTNWGIPRSFVGYRVDPTVQALGNAPKWILKSIDGGPDYILKKSYRYGLQETLTELFINHFGLACGFDMAHSGLASVDGEPVFATRSFLGPTEHLVHGSFLIESFFQATGELDGLHRTDEQEFYSIDFVSATLAGYCDPNHEEVLQKFIEMVLFDALVGSTDRHAQNWGVVRGAEAVSGYRFSPIFDTARALLWNVSEAKISSYLKQQDLLLNYVGRARPIFGPERRHPNVGKCNHFDFIQNLLGLFERPTYYALGKIPADVGRVARSVVNKFPFRGAFSQARRELLVKLISLRADKLREIGEMGGMKWSARA